MSPERSFKAIMSREIRTPLSLRVTRAIVTRTFPPSAHAVIAYAASSRGSGRLATAL